MFSQYEDWKRTRNIIKKSFADSYLKRITYIIDESIEQLTQTLIPIAINSDMTDMFKHLSQFTLNIAMRTFFGVNTEEITEEILENTTKITSPKITFDKVIAVIFPRISNFFGLKFNDKKATNYLADLTKKLINQIKGIDSRRDNFLEYMLRAERNGKSIDENCKIVLKIFIL